MAYVAFTTSLRGAASSWLQYFTDVNRHNLQEWNSIRPHFCNAFDSKCHINNYSYTSAITSLFKQYSTSAMVTPPNGHTFTAAQILQIKGMMHDELKEFRNDLHKKGIQIDSMTSFVGRLVPGAQQTSCDTDPDTTHNNLSQTGGNTKQTNTNCFASIVANKITNKKNVDIES